MNSFQYLINKVYARLSNWHGRYLAFVGRITLAKFVINTILMYYIKII